MNIILFDDIFSDDLLPLTYTRPVSEIRIGILTIAEKWNKCYSQDCSYHTKAYLSSKYKCNISDENLLINASVCPNEVLLNEISELKQNQKLISDHKLIALKLSKDQFNDLLSQADGTLKKSFSYLLQKIDFEKVNSQFNGLIVNNLWDIFSKNAQAIESDFDLITKGRESEKLCESNTIVGKGRIFVEPGAKASCSVFNTSTGSIYLGHDSEIMEGCLIRGPFALGDHAGLKMGAKIYGATTVGPFSKVGGEVNNSVLFAYSNKGHDGFLGNSVIGEWCNLGADTNNSNLKNNYGSVQLWSYNENKYIDTKLQFCGLIMADHAKCGINTMFNTGTVVGVNANIFGSGFPSKNIPSFSWGGAQGFETYDLEKANEVAARVFERRNKTFDQTEQEILGQVFNLTKSHRV